MRFATIFFGAISFAFLSGVFMSCRDNTIDLESDVGLTFSVDTLLFDTVFTTVGSATRTFKVYNSHNKRVRISSITVGGGANSFFRINVNGIPGITHNDVEIAANDSIFVFAEVTLDPLDSNFPLIVLDSMVFVTNNKVQNIKLAAWGQDATFLQANYPADNPQFHLVAENTVWTADKPYVLYSTVVVAPGVVLDVLEDARVHLHRGKSLYFLDNSTFRVNGSLEKPVIFQGDRLEQFFDNKPGQWGRIAFSPQSVGHEINYAIIKNGTVGLHFGSIGTPSGTDYQVNNTVIKNMSSTGLMVVESNLVAKNTVIVNCGEFLVYVGPGGSASFLHCTLANYFSMPNTATRQTPLLLYANYFYYQEEENGPILVYNKDIGPTFFGNTILHGNLDEEVNFDLLTGTSYNGYFFDHCLLKTNLDVSGPAFETVIKNQDPGFYDRANQDYRLTEPSPVINAGNPAISIQVPFDILGNNRINQNDLGAYIYYPIPEEED